MIQTVPRKISNEEISLSKNYNAIRTFYFEQILRDQVEEEAFDTLKFPLDKDVNGNVHDGLRQTKVIHCKRPRAFSTEMIR